MLHINSLFDRALNGDFIRIRICPVRELIASLLTNLFHRRSVRQEVFLFKLELTLSEQIIASRMSSHLDYLSLFNLLELSIHGIYI